MKKFFSLQLILMLTLTTLYGQNQEQLLLNGWRFQKGNVVNAEKTNFDDSKWQQVTIPHDWAISGPFDKEIDKQVVAIVQNGEQEATEKTGRSGSLPWIGEGWYRTKLSIPDNYNHAELVFDGAMSEPKIYIEGKLAGYWAYGYNTFAIDITPYLPKKDGKIIHGNYSLAVHLQNVDESSRWYPGAGLYRPVRLKLSQKTAVKTFGIFARTTRIDGISDDFQSAKSARIAVNTQIRVDGDKKSNVRVKHSLISEGNILTSTETSMNDSRETSQALVVNNPRLWSPEQPYLYSLVTEVFEDGKLVDVQKTTIGIRSIEYGGEGFRLNGKLTKFRGVCLHHDLGPLGAAFNKTAFRRQITLLKDIGCNAIRTSHNMPAPWQMDICDEMGIMVMAESFDMWVYPKCKNGYAKFFEQVDTQSPNADSRPWWKRDIENLVVVHRNHPSIVMWSIGNEIPEQSGADGLKYTREMQNFIHSLDNTRLCTQGLDRGDGAIWAGVFQESDVPGFNYRLHVYDKGHENSPSGLVLGTETASTVSSRGVYKFPVEENHGDAYEDGQIDRKSVV